MSQKFKRPFHLLIDGPDKVGKTTVINLLSRKLGIPVIKMPNMPEYIEKDQPEQYSKLFNQTIVQFSDYDFIMDRGFTTSLAYSKAFDRTFDLGYIKTIQGLLKPTVFILMPDTSSDTFEEDDIEKIKNRKTKIIESYDNLLKENPEYHHVIVTGQSPHEICNQILETILSEEGSLA